MYSAPADNVARFLLALTKLLLSSAVFKAYLALGAVSVVACLLVATCPAYCRMSAEVWLAPLVYIYVHEVAQYIALGAEVELKLEGGYIVLEPRGKPKWPRGAVIAGALAPTAISLASLLYAPLFSLIILIAVVLTSVRYVKG